MVKEKLYKYVTVKYLSARGKYTFLYPKEQITEGEILLIANNKHEIKVEVLEIFECPKMTNFKYKKLDVLEHLSDVNYDPSRIISDSVEAKKRVVNKPSNLELVSDELKNDKDFILDAMKALSKKEFVYPEEAPLLLKYIGNDLRNNKEFALGAIKYIYSDDVSYLQYFGEDILNDEEVIFEAIKLEPLVKTEVYKYIGDRLKKDKNFLIRLLQKKYNFISLIDDSIKDDFEFGYRLLTEFKSPMLFRFLSKNLRSNKDLINIFLSNKYVGRDEKYYVYVTERENKEFFYPIHSHIMNKIIIDKKYDDLLVKKNSKKNTFELDFTLLEDSDIARECTEEVRNHPNEIKIDYKDDKCEIMFYCRNEKGYFNHFVELLFSKLKNDIDWNFEIFELLRHDEYHVDWGKYPQEIVHLFYEDGLIADEFLLNQKYVNYE